MSNMALKTLCLSIASAILAGCAETNELSQAAAHYRHHYDYASLQTVNRLLEKGMPRRRVLALLGEGYSPGEGQYYFSSDRREYVEEAERELTVVLIVEFRDENANMTGKLQSWILGSVGE